MPEDFTTDRLGRPVRAPLARFAYHRFESLPKLRKQIVLGVFCQRLLDAVESRVVLESEEGGAFVSLMREHVLAVTFGEMSFVEARGRLGFSDAEFLDKNFLLMTLFGAWRGCAFVFEEGDDYASVFGAALGVFASFFAARSEMITERGGVEMERRAVIQGRLLAKEAELWRVATDVAWAESLEWRSRSELQELMTARSRGTPLFSAVQFR